MPNTRRQKEITRNKVENQNKFQPKKPTRSGPLQNNIPASLNSVVKRGCNNKKQLPQRNKKNYLREKILDKRKDKVDGFEYLVKWKGHANDKNSWESYKNIFPPSLVAEYEGRKALERQEEFLSGN